MQDQALRGFPLSRSQRRIWLLEREAGTAFQTTGRVAVRGPLDPRRLLAAIEAVARRHEILRTTFRQLTGMTLPLQVIDPEPRLALLEEGPGDPADPATGPPLRVRLRPLGCGEHELRLTLPAMCCDGPGLALLIGEIAARYGAGGPGDEEPTQYADFAQWQEDQLATPEGAAQRELWRRLAPAIRSAARLPGVAAPAPGEPCRPAALAVELAPALARELRALAARRGTHLEAVILAGWQALLLRLTGAEEIVVAVADDGRPFKELQEAIGPYEQFLPLRLAVSPERSFEEVLAAVHELAGDVRSLQEGFVPEDLASPGEEGRPVLLPFAFDAAPACPVWHGDGITFQLLELESHGDCFEARLSCRAAEDRVRLELRHDAVRIDSVTAALLLQRFQALLASAAARPAALLSGLEILGEAERHRLLVELNDTERELGAGACLHDLFFAQAAATPDALALIAETESLTFAGLAGRARLLADHLAGLGVERGSRVALCADRVPEAVTGILGILAADGCYVPLDPAHPAERLAFLFADSRPRVVLTLERHLERLPPSPAPVVCLDRDAAAIAAAGPRRLSARATPDDPAYVIYTSGSTGTPKGVMVSHRAIANRLLWMRDELPLGPGDRVAVKTLFGFDASLWEIFVPLFSGVPMVLARPDGHRDSAYLAELVAAQGITILQLVPSMLGAFLEEPRVREGLPLLRRLFCGGEALSPARAQRVSELLGAELHNLYGPTESSIDATHWRCPWEAVPAVIPIGRPIANVRIYVTDPEFRPVPAGLAGELCVAGAGLALGYQERAGLTAERFVPDPFSSRPGARLYRTGDLARYLPSGELELLGRTDHQVKVRGFRIELGEIEAELIRHPGVLDAVAAVREQHGDPRLIAYVVPRQGHEAAAAELRAFLAGRLPEPMVPSTFVPLHALPRTASGKVSRRDLPEPPAAEPAAEVAPRTLSEDLVAGIWSQVLGLESVGVADDFFTLGGHSLLATQVVSRIRETLGVDLSLRALLANTTVAAQAAAVDAARAHQRGLEIPPIAPVPRDRPLPLSFAQQRLWIVQQLDPQSPAFNVPLAVRLRGALDLGAVAWSFAEIWRRHEVLRTVFDEIDRQPVQRIAGSAVPRISLVDLAALPAGRRETAAAAILSAELSRPFDLRRGPLQRITLLRLADDEHEALLTTHHSVADAWSSAVMIRELSALYGARLAGQPSPLPELPVQYADFAAWQRGWLRGEALEAQLGFWRRHLEGAAPRLALSTDRPRPPVASQRGGLRPHFFAEGVAESLRRMSRREGATPFMVLLAAFYVLLNYLTGEDDLVVGTDIANRNRLETEPLIGFFINQLALRARLDGLESFRDLLRQVRETTLDAYAHQDVPFDKVVEALQPERTLAHAPVFQVKLNVQNVAAQALEAPGLTLEPLDVASTTSQLDLVVNVVDNGEGFFGSMQYSTDLFLAETVDEWWVEYERILAAVIGRPDMALRDLAETLDQARRDRRAERDRQLEQASLERLRKGRRAPVRVAAGVGPVEEP